MPRPLRALPALLALAALALLPTACSTPVAWGGGSAGIYVVGADGSGLTRLTDAPARPAWSPAGDRLAFVDEDGVWVIGADGSGRARVAEADRPGPTVWSPDGGRLAFVDPGAQALRIVAVDGSGEVARPLLEEAPGNDLVAIAVDAPPVWSPDGARVAYVSWDGNGDEVYTVAAAGEAADLIQISDIPAGSSPIRRDDPRGQRIAVGNAAAPSWAPDGERLAFARFPEARGSTGGLYLVDADGTGQDRLTRVEPLAGAHWSGDGRKLLFGARREGQEDVYVINLRGFGLLANLTRTHPGQSRDPVWSPDGRQIAFASDGDLWLMSADGSGKHPLAATALRDHTPVWSPDGSRLAFVSEPVIG